MESREYGVKTAMCAVEGLKRGKVIGIGKVECAEGKQGPMNRHMGLSCLVFQDEHCHETGSGRHAELPIAMLQLFTTPMKQNM